MPVDFAEHHVAGEDHHLGGRLAFVGDRQRVARFVEAQAADQPAAVEVAAVGHAGVQAVAHQVVDLVDVDRPGEHARQQPALRCRSRVPAIRSATSRGSSDQSSRSTSAISPSVMNRWRKQFVVGHVRQVQVFDRMAERPVADVVQQRGRQEPLGIRRDRSSRRIVRPRRADARNSSATW